jgi:hypothetical protein
LNKELIWDQLGLDCCGHNSAVDDQIVAVLELVSGPDFIFNDDIAEKTGMTKEHVELIQYLLCSADLAEYGTSPRGCWGTEKAQQLLLKIWSTPPND